MGRPIAEGWQEDQFPTDWACQLGRGKQHADELIPRQLKEADFADGQDACFDDGRKKGRYFAASQEEDPD
jgi:hypothetical protein